MLVAVDVRNRDTRVPDSRKLGRALALQVRRAETIQHRSDDDRALAEKLASFVDKCWDIGQRLPFAKIEVHTDANLMLKREDGRKRVVRPWRVGHGGHRCDDIPIDAAEYGYRRLDGAPEVVSVQNDSADLMTHPDTRRDRYRCT